MEVDWFTVIAQILNFLVLVWLLKRFLYKPVLNAIDEREKKIASELEDAALHKAEARKEKEKFLQKNKTFDDELDTKMEEVRQKIESKKQRLFEEARLESEALQAQLKVSLEKQEDDIKERIKLKTKEEVLAIAGKILSDIADVDLEEQIIRVFIDKIKNLDEAEKSKLLEALHTTHGKVKIISAFELSDASKKQLQTVLRELKADLDISYELNSKIVSGVVLETQNFQLSWSIDSFLSSMKTDII